MFSLGLDRSSLIDSWPIFQSDRFGNREAGASVGQTCRNFYTDFTLWETFRNLRPKSNSFANGKSLFRLGPLVVWRPHRRINAQNADRRERPRKRKGQKKAYEDRCFGNRSSIYLPFQSLWLNYRAVISKGENFIKMRVAQSLPSFDINREIMKSMEFL